MTLPIITSLYAGLLGLLALVLSLEVSRQRRANKVSLGDGGVPSLMKAIRVHANFTENVPQILIMIMLLELTAHSPMLIHLLGSGLFLGRIAHAIGMHGKGHPHPGRIIGSALTLTIFIVAPVLLIWSAVSGILAT